jgi:chromosomal replication initiation ATPase DnaA
MKLEQEIRKAKDIVYRVAEVTGVPAEAIRSSEHIPRYVFARHLGYSVAKRLGLSLKAISRAFGGKNKQGILYGVRRIEKESRAVEGLSELVEFLCQQSQQGWENAETL